MKTIDEKSKLDMRKSVEVQVDSDFALLLPGGVYEIIKMEPRLRIRPIVFTCLLLAVAGIIGFGYFCPDRVNITIHNDKNYNNNNTNKYFYFYK